MLATRSQKIPTRGILRKPSDFASKLQAAEGVTRVTFEIAPLMQQKEEDYKNLQNANKSVKKTEKKLQFSAYTLEIVDPK